MRSFVLLLACSCGGKIVETAPIDDDRMVSAKAPTTAEPNEEKEKDKRQPGAVAPATMSSADACTILCERDARCDTTLPALPVREGEGGDCASRCQERLAGKCGIDDWLLCYAAHITPDACTALPDECRPGFCAWAQCARQPVSNCD